MNLGQQSTNVTAYSEDDVQRQPPAKATSGNKDYQRGVLHKLPCVQLKKQMENIKHLKIGSLNVGSLTGKGQELVDVMCKGERLIYYVCRKQGGRVIV